MQIGKNTSEDLYVTPAIEQKKIAFSGWACYFYRKEEPQLYNPPQLKKYFEGRIAIYRRAAVLRYVLTSFCLLTSAFSFYYAITYTAAQTELYK
jgi:hypothetical protein